GLAVIVGTPGLALAADPDWKAVEQALGKSGQLQPGDVFRIGMPRTDLAVSVKGVPVKAGFALGSYAAFKQVGDQSMVMGDLAPRHVHALRGTWRRRPDGEGAAPGVVGERNAAERYSRGAGDLRRTGARHQADRTGAWPSGARHRRRRVPGDGAARGSNHPD